MKQEDLVPGAIYMVRGGHLLRYQGPFREEGPSHLAFSSVSRPLESPPAGASIAADDVLYRITAAEAGLLKRRWGQVQRRPELHESLQEVELIFEELGLEKPVVTANKHSK